MRGAAVGHNFMSTRNKSLEFVPIRCRDAFGVQGVTASESAILTGLSESLIK